jgi:potassium-dependent mechanosensitive channel
VPFGQRTAWIIVKLAPGAIVMAKFPHRISIWCSIFLCSLGLIYFSHSPLQAATPAVPTTQAAIVLDGRTLFEVSDAGTFKAKERAEIVNRQLAETLKSSQLSNPPTVRIEERDQQQTLLLNDSYLLTVTTKDTANNSIPQQADRWAETIRNNLQTALEQRSSSYIKQAIGIALGILAVTLVLHWLMGRLGQRLNRRIAVPDRDNPLPTGQWGVNLLLWVARTSLWITAALYITNLFPWTRRWSYEISRTAIASFSTPILTLGKVSYSLTELLILGLGLVAWIIVASLLTAWIRRHILNTTRIDRANQAIIATIIRYILILIGALVLLQIWGMNISSLTIVASALGLGIGFGLQDLAKNISGGFVMLFERLVQVGDYVEVGEYKGTVEHIGTRSTQIKTLDNACIIVPNVRFLEKEVINWNADDRSSRIHIPLAIAYGADPTQVQTLLLDLATKHPEVLSNPAPQLLLKGFVNNALNFELLVWIDRPDQQSRIISDLNYQIYDCLQQHDIHLTPEIGQK